MGATDFAIDVNRAFAPTPTTRNPNRMKLLQHSNLHQFYLQLIHEGREKFGAPVFFIFFLLFSAPLSLGLKCSGEGETVLTNRDEYVLCGWSITGLSLCSTLINMIM